MKEKKHNSNFGHSIDVEQNAKQMSSITLKNQTFSIQGNKLLKFIIGKTI